MDLLEAMPTLKILIVSTPPWGKKETEVMLDILSRIITS